MFQGFGPLVLPEVILASTTLGNSAFELLISLLVRIDGRFVIVPLRWGWIDATDEWIYESELLIGIKNHPDACPDDSEDTTYETKYKI